MCELLGMSANVPTDICFSFRGLIQRGGRTGPHADGWGIVFYEGKGVQSFKDPAPSCQSKIAELVCQYPIKSCAIIGHIRQANRGEVSLANTHPFTRELWGRYWTFAHNGQLAEFEHLPTGSFTPVGQTDSEHAFCWLLNQLSQRFSSPPANKNQLFEFIAMCCEQLCQFGVFNMVLSDGDYVMAYCTNNLCWLTRRAPFGQASLIDDDLAVDFDGQTAPTDVVTLIATKPLTRDEPWCSMKPNQWAVFHFGERAFSGAKSKLKQ